MLFKNIQGLRAIAAMMVVIAHSFFPVVPLQHHWFGRYVGAVGPAGVDLFFVISGFVVFLSADRSGKKAAIIGRRQAFREFAVKRIVRIYPIYWIAFAVASLILATTAIQIAALGLKPRPLLGMLLLVDEQGNTRITAAWTLVYEMSFYTVCALSILVWPRHIALVMASWFFVVLLIWVTGTYNSATALKPLVLEFGFGIVVAQLVQRKVSSYAASSLAVGIGGLLLGAVYFYHATSWGGPHMWRVMCFGLPSSLILYGLVAVEMRQGWTFSKRWVDFGDTSYSLYLWHYPVLCIMAAGYAQLNIMDTVPPLLLAAISAAVAIAVGYVSYNRIEIPINKAGWVARLAGVVHKEPPAPSSVLVLKNAA